MSPPPPPEITWSQTHDALYPLPPPIAPRKRKPGKSTWLIGKLADGVFDLHIPEIHFVAARANVLSTAKYLDTLGACPYGFAFFPVPLLPLFCLVCRYFMIPT